MYDDHYKTKGGGGRRGKKRPQENVDKKKKKERKCIGCILSPTRPSQMKQVVDLKTSKNGPGNHGALKSGRRQKESDRQIGAD